MTHKIVSISLTIFRTFTISKCFNRQCVLLKALPAPTRVTEKKNPPPPIIDFLLRRSTSSVTPQTKWLSHGLPIRLWHDRVSFEQIVESKVVKGHTENRADKSVNSHRTCYREDREKGAIEMTSTFKSLMHWQTKFLQPVSNIGWSHSNKVLVNFKMVRYLNFLFKMYVTRDPFFNFFVWFPSWSVFQSGH